MVRTEQEVFPLTCFSQLWHVRYLNDPSPCNATACPDRGKSSPGKCINPELLFVIVHLLTLYIMTDWFMVCLQVILWSALTAKGMICDSFKNEYKKNAPY